jgi:ankyrin repeat protein
MAAQEGHLEIVQLLLEAGATLNGAFKGVTPRMIAAQHGHFKVVQALLQAEAV